MSQRNQNKPLSAGFKGLGAVAADNRALNSLLDALRDAVLYFDRWGVVQHANACACRWWGENELYGKTFIEVARNWDDPAERQREIMQVYRTGLPVLESRERSRLHGKDCWFQVDKLPTADPSGALVGVMLVISDITQTVERENVLRDSESRYRAFIASSSNLALRYLPAHRYPTAQESAGTADYGAGGAGGVQRPAACALRCGERQ